MSSALHFWLAVCLLGAGLGIGCQTSSRNTAPTAKKAEAKGAVQAIGTERRVQAYAHYAAGLGHDLNGRPDQALEEYRLSLAADPTYEPLLIDVARRLTRAQKHDEVIELLRTAVAAGLQSGSVYGWLALAYSHSGKPDLAIEANKMAMQKAPTALGGYQNLSQLYLQTGKTNLAVQVLDSAARVKDVDADFLIGLSEIYTRLAKANIINQEESKKRALELLDRANGAQAPGGGITLQKLGDGYFSFAEYKKAKPVYERVMRDFPDVPMIREKLVNVYLRLGEKPEAVKLLEEIRKENPTDPQNYFFLGGMAYEEKNFAQAAEYYETALQLSPDFEQLYYDLAGLKISLKKPKEALEVLTKARSRFKLNFLMEFYSGVAESLLENYKAAIGYFTSAEIVAKATDPAKLTHHFYYQAGAAYERAGQREDAEKQFRQCLKINPDYAEGLNYLGYMWAEHGEKLDEALPMIQKAVELQPKNAAFLDSLGWVLYKLNRPADALSPMREAIKLIEEPDATLLDHLGDIYLALKDFDQARDSWSKSIKLQASEEIKKKLDHLPKTPSSPGPR